jgi:type IV pilus assembly protein PilM
MGFFKTTIGIDVGGSSIKIVELSRFGKRVNLKNYAELQSAKIDGKPFRAFKAGSLLLAEKETAQVISFSFRESGIEAGKTVLTLPDFLTFFAILDFPSMSKEELGQAVRFEAIKVIPAPLAEMLLDWSVVRGIPGKNQPLAVLIVAIPKIITSQYNKLAQQIPLSDYVLEPEAFSLFRVFLTSHSLDIAGEDITKELVNSLNITYQEAESLKRKEGLTSGTKGVRDILEIETNKLLNAVQGVIGSTSSDHKEKIAKIILVGGGAKMPGLIDYCSAQMKIETELGQPFRGINYPNILKPELEKMGPSFGVALGAALRHF